jgi:hypothetical protein
LRITRADAAADIRLDAASENFIFYISPMYDFSHGLREAVFLFARPPAKQHLGQVNAAGTDFGFQIVNGRRIPSSRDYNLNFFEDEN